MKRLQPLGVCPRLALQRLGILLVLAACSSSPQPPPVDETLSGFGHAGDIAIGLEKPKQAAEQYRLALGRARERDDAAAIADAGFNLATAQLRDNQPTAALATAQQIRAELARRGRTDAGLDLVTATGLFRAGRLEEADRWAGRLNGTTPVANRARFLRGLIADERGDRAALAGAETAMTAEADAGDRAELQARFRRDPALALAAADLRRNALDYRGMARALALAAKFTPDQARAADLYLRAGRSAAAQRDTEQARAWLLQARRKARNPGLRRQVEQTIRALK